MKLDENNIQESVGSRTQVAKNPKYARLTFPPKIRP